MYFFGVALAVLYVYEMYVYCIICSMLIIIVAIVGGTYEGIRYP